MKVFTLLCFTLGFFLTFANGVDKQEVLNRANTYLSGVRAQMNEQRAPQLNPQKVIDLAKELHQKNVAAAQSKKNPEDRKRTQTQLDRQAAAITHAETMQAENPEAFNAEATRGLKRRLPSTAGRINGGGPISGARASLNDQDFHSRLREDLRDPVKKQAFHDRVMGHVNKKAQEQ